MHLDEAIEQYLDACKEMDALTDEELRLAQHKQTLNRRLKDAFEAICLRLNPGETLPLDDGRAVTRVPSANGNSVYITTLRPAR